MSNTTEEKILQTAMTVFLEKGKHGAKMQEIADRANINNAMLHYYFRNKEKLYKNIFRMVFSKIFGRLEKIFIENERFSDALRLFIDAYIDFVNHNPQIPMFILRELSYKGNDLKEIVAELMNENNFPLPGTFIESLNKSIKKGEIRAVDPFQLLITIIGACLFFFIAEPVLSTVINKSKDFNREQFIEQRKKAILDQLLNGIRANGSRSEMRNE
jgi:TetR/AcrR family transcriptional regulator